MATKPHPQSMAVMRDNHATAVKAALAKFQADHRPRVAPEKVARRAWFHRRVWVPAHFVGKRFGSGRITCVDEIPSMAACSTLLIAGEEARIKVFDLHHMAHLMTPDNVALHGKEYGKAAVELARYMYGELEGAELGDALRKAGLKIHIWSPEAKARALARKEVRKTERSATIQSKYLNLIEELTKGN